MKLHWRNAGLAVAIALTVVTLSRCSDVAPCAVCPNVEGRYTLVHKESAISSGCDSNYQPPLELSLSREGSALTANYNNAVLTGTLYDTYDMVLNGSQQAGAGRTVTTRLRARYIEPLPSSDAGAKLDGRVTRDLISADGGVCSVEHELTGHKAP